MKTKYADSILYSFGHAESPEKGDSKLFTWVVVGSKLTWDTRHMSLKFVRGSPECLPDEETAETCDSPTPDNLQCKPFHSLLGDHTAGIHQRVLVLQKSTIKIRGDD